MGRCGLALALLLLGGCGRGEDPAAPRPARLAALREKLAFPAAEGPLAPVFGEAVALPGGGRATPVAFDLRPGFGLAAALFEPAQPGPFGVIVAHGHYGQGKNSEEAQEIALALAADGVVALAIDTPGVEEGARPGRLLHLGEGAHNRAFLAAGGSSALALQVAGLRRGLDLLESRGLRRFAATGASGGAVQSFYLMLVDDRIEAAILASFPPIPREARAGGCPCDLLPGDPGPDPGLLALAERPSLWLSELPQPRPEGLPRAAEFQVFEGPHSYTAEMQAAALRWLDARWERPAPPAPGPAAHLELHVAALGPLSIFDLPLAPQARWTPGRSPGLSVEQRCDGLGPAVLLAGGEAADAAALRAAGLRVCAASLIGDDEVAESEALARQAPFVDQVAGALAEAARRTGATAAYGVRAWGLPVAALGLPYVVRDPIRQVGEVDPARDPAWVHVPGAWWGALEPVYAGAVATGEDPGALAEALR